MGFKNTEEVFDTLRKYQSIPNWVTDSRTTHKRLKALVTGEDFTELLINQFEKLESKDRAVAREKYSKDVRDLFNRVYAPRENVFRASGGSVVDRFMSEAIRQRYLDTVKNYKGQKSIKQYLQDYFFILADVDPNGLIFTEYKDDKNIYPTYKSIDDIRVYKSNGQLCEFVIFEPIDVYINDTTIKKWRIVDDKREYSILQKGNDFYLNEDESFDHPFGVVPAVILSSNQKTGTELRISNLFPIVALSEDYAIRKSRYTIYDIQCGFPDRWRYEKTCRSCHGTGKTGDGASCGSCSGKSRDVTDVNVIEMPREDDPILPAMSGYVSPALDWLNATELTLEKNEDKIDATVWGTKRISEGGNETATGRFIDIQPVENRLYAYSRLVEWVHNQLSIYVQSWINGKPVKDNQFYVSYGYRFIIESQDTIIERYSKSRQEGDNITILDKALDEVILVKNQNNPKALEIAQKKRNVEPYVHNSIKEVFDIFGSREAAKKTVFVQFWQQVDTEKEVDVLIKEFNTYFEETNLGIQVNNQID